MIFKWEKMKLKKLCWLLFIPEILTDELKDDSAAVEDPEGADGGYVGRQDVPRVDARVQKLRVKHLQQNIAKRIV